LGINKEYLYYIGEMCSLKCFVNVTSEDCIFPRFCKEFVNFITLYLNSKKTGCAGKSKMLE